MSAPVRILVLSDLHLEFAYFHPPDPDFFDLIVLAGDICAGTAAVRWALRARNFGGKPVILTPGNHEFYGSQRTRMLAELRKAAASTQVYVLDRDEVTLQGIRFLGTTLWTDMRLDAANGTDVAQAMRDATRGMNDFAGAIRERRADDCEPRRFSPEDAAHEHSLSRAWLLERLQTTSTVPTVIVTHHAPSPLSMDPIYEGSELNPCYYSKLEDAFFKTAALWVHGHTHSSCDYRLHNTRVVANPRGYRRRGANENPNFNPCLVITLESGVDRV